MATSCRRLSVTGFAWVVALTAILSSRAWAVDVVITTTDGRTFEGSLISKSKETVSLLVSGITVPIPREQVRSIQYKQSMEQRYAERRARLADTDADGRYALAYWLFEQKAYTLAQKELDSLAAAFPEDARVKLLRQIVADRLAPPRQQTTVPVDGGPTAPPPAGRSGPSQQGVQTTPRLTPEQINLIKVYEINLDAKPRVIVPRKVMEKVFASYADHPQMPKGKNELAQLRNAQGYEKLQLLFDLRARELYSLVQVQDDPPVMQEFRTNIHQRYVVNYCGTTACHGGDGGAGGFRLLRDATDTDKTVYTNFITLQSTHVGPLDMISRQQPDRSLLLQYGLARTTATTPHPEAKGWRPKFHAMQDGFLQATSRWIDSLWKPTPDYGIKAPPSAATTQPVQPQPPTPITP